MRSLCTIERIVKVSERYERAKAILADARVHILAEGEAGEEVRFHFVEGTKGEFYQIDQQAGTCECGDFTKFAKEEIGGWCKHRIAVALWEQKRDTFINNHGVEADERADKLTQTRQQAELVPA